MDWSWSATALALTMALGGVRLVRPFVGHGGPWTWALGFVVGSAAWTVGADLGVKACGPGWLGFVAIPGALLFAAGFPTRGRGPNDAPPGPETTPVQAGLALLFALVAAAQVVPVRTAAGIAWGTPEMDWRSRIPTVGALARDGLPAANPFFDPDGEHQLFFYYGWFLPPAAAVRCGGAEPAAAVLAFMAFGAWALAVLTMGLANALAGDRKAGTVAGALLFVTGLDLLPVLALEAKGVHPQSLEWWNPGQVTAPYAAPVWVPHHAMATLEILAAAALLHLAERRGLPWRRAWLAPALALAGAGMSSTYVALVGFAALGMAALAAPKLRLAHWGALAAAGAACVPFYWQLSKLDRHGGAALLPLLRTFATDFEVRDALVERLGMAPPLALFLARLGGLLPGYFIEFGVLFLALLWWRRSKLGMAPGGWGRPLALLVGVAFAIGSVLVSVRTWNADLNWRTMHVVQLALTAVGASFLRRMPRSEWLFVGPILAVGIAGTAYDLYRTRRDIPAERPEWVVGAARARDAGAALNATLPWSTRVLIDPDGNPFWMHHLRHRVILADTVFNCFPYGPKEQDVKAAIDEVRRILNARTPAEERQRLLRKLKVEVVLLEREAPLFAAALDAFGAGATVAWQSDDCKLVRVAAP